MPILDLEIVSGSDTGIERHSARAIADVLGRVFSTPAGRTWVRMRHLSLAAYAENDTELDELALPVFVTVLHANPPQGESLASEARAVTMAIAQALAIDATRVHVQYAPPGAGRQAFGGDLVL